MDFSDPLHSADDLVIQGVNERQPGEICSDTILRALDQWCSRPIASEAPSSAFLLDKTQSFTISYDAKATNYFPGEQQNWLSESLTRDILFKDGICTLTDLTSRVYVITYQVLALTGVEYLLVCPYPSDSGNIAGVVVVCVNHYLQDGITIN